MTTATQARSPRAVPSVPPAQGVGAAFGRSLGQALLVGALTAAVFLVVRGAESGLSALFGLAIAGLTFGAALLLMAAPLRRAHPQVMFVVALTLYGVQMVALLVVYDVSRQFAWLDGVAVGVTILVVALVWQVAQMIAWRRARTLVFDEAGDPRA